jgi:hypothetical protein
LLPLGIILSPFLLWNAWRDRKEQLAEQKRRALEKINPAPDIAVYLTDGFGSFPAEPPKVSSLWVILPGGLPSHKFPFGETARMTEKKVFESLV